MVCIVSVLPYWSNVRCSCFLIPYLCGYRMVTKLRFAQHWSTHVVLMSLFSTRCSPNSVGNKVTAHPSQSLTSCSRLSCDSLMHRWKTLTGSSVIGTDVWLHWEVNKDRVINGAIFIQWDATKIYPHSSLSVLNCIRRASNGGRETEYYDCVCLCVCVCVCSCPSLDVSC